MDELKEVLAELVQPGPVSRDIIVADMETATMKNAASLVSAALKQPELSEKYGMRVGKGGGVYLKDINDLEPDSNSEVDNDVDNVNLVQDTENCDAQVTL
jgi:hypothetical protein